MPANNYDPIARWYDLLSQLVFGHAQKRAQIALLPHIPANSRMLIVGGGSGWILPEIAKIHPSGLQITYVEISQKMIGLARQQNTAQNTVQFINQPIENVQLDEFDVIITAFLFDNFTAVHAATIWSQLNTSLKPGGHWLFTDFNATEARHKFWQKAMLAAMYSFFRLICKIEASQLVNMQPHFSASGYTPSFTTHTYRRFIYSAVYQKST